MIVGARGHGFPVSRGPRFRNGVRLQGHLSPCPSARSSTSCCVSSSGRSIMMAHGQSPSCCEAQRRTSVTSSSSSKHCLRAFVPRMSYLETTCLRRKWVQPQQSTCKPPPPQLGKQKKKKKNTSIHNTGPHAQTNEATSVPFDGSLLSRLPSSHPTLAGPAIGLPIKHPS